MKLNCKEIQSRHSSRIFDKSKKVEDDIINKIMYAGTLAPSGKNIQPWRFRLIKDEKNIYKIMEYLPNNQWIKNSNLLIMVYLDLNESYDYVKDLMSIGAVIENMLLEAESNGISSCWIGECVENQDAISNFMGDKENHKLMAIVAFGYVKFNLPKVSKKTITDILL